MDDLVIVGGGPSGLAAAHEAAEAGARVTVIEREPLVGGLSRTLQFAGNRFDIGPHRFFTKNDEINALFERVLGEDVLRVSRFSRILHDGHYFDYPLTPLNAMFGMGLGSSIAIFASYAAARLRAGLAPRRIETFEDWVTDRFGRRLYEAFFKGYTEKVWGVPCRSISSEWAAQRIRGLSLGAVAHNALFKPKRKKIKSLVDAFLYPRHGAGQVYERMAAIVTGKGSAVLTGATVRSLRREGARVRAATIWRKNGGRAEVEGRFFLVSAPITDLVEMIDPPPPPEVLAAARALRFRDHIGVNFVIRGPLFPDNWLYVHDKDVALARIGNYRRFSPAMASGPDVSPITAEYFAFPDDPLARLPDARLIAHAIEELTRLRILTPDQVIDGFVVRSRKAYPVMEMGYERHLATIKAWLDGFENLLPIGRSGMFKYNNQDHAMATGLLAARTALDVRLFDPWAVNIDAEYHEAGAAR